MKQALVFTVVAASVAYVAMAAFMYVAQRKFQYFPQASAAQGFEPAAQYQLAGFDDVTIPTEDGEMLRAWYYARPNDDVPVILYMHGNAGSLADRHERFALFAREGFGVLAISWRGFGGSTGSPSEAGLLEDGKAALRFLQGKGVDGSGVVLFGESLGTGIAVQLAADPATTPKAMILEAPYTSAADVARNQYWFLPVELLMKDQFRSTEHAPQVTAPVFVFHGTADRIIPFQQGKRLSQAFAGPVQFHVMNGSGHIDPLTPESWGAIKAFLGAHGASARG